MKVPGRLCANCKNMKKFTESEKCQECYYTEETKLQIEKERRKKNESARPSVRKL